MISSLFRTLNPNDSVKKKKKRSHPSLLYNNPQSEEEGPYDEEFELEKVDRVVKRLRISKQQDEMEEPDSDSPDEEEETSQIEEDRYINTGYTHPPMSMYFPSSEELEESNVNYPKISELLKKVHTEREMRKKFKK